MVTDRKPVIFGKDRFCKAVVGHTDSELIEMMSLAHVVPEDERINLSVGRDTPRDDGEGMVDRYEIFMNSNYRVPLLDIPIEELYEAFRRYRAWEEHIHPRAQFIHHEGYWGPTYREIEEAHKRGDEKGIREGVVRLVDQILHD